MTRLPSAGTLQHFLSRFDQVSGSIMLNPSFFFQVGQWSLSYQVPTMHTKSLNCGWMSQVMPANNKRAILLADKILLAPLGSYWSIFSLYDGTGSKTSASNYKIWVDSLKPYPISLELWIFNSNLSNKWPFRSLLVIMKPLCHLYLVSLLTHAINHYSQKQSFLDTRDFVC